MDNRLGRESHRRNLDLDIRKRFRLTCKEPPLRFFSIRQSKTERLARINTTAQEPRLACATLTFHASTGIVNPGHQRSIKDSFRLGDLQLLAEIHKVNFHPKRSLYASASCSWLVTTCRMPL